MGFKCGIVGLPNVGKSTLFNALTQADIEAANYPFCTIDPNVGVVAMPDPRLTAISDLIKPQKTIPTSMQFVDIAGLVAGASKGEGLGNQFLAHIRETDAIAHVVRCFDNDDITHVDNKIDPLSDIDTIHTELMLADMEMLQNRLQRLQKQSKSGADKAAKAESLLVEKCLAHLDAGHLAMSFDDEAFKATEAFQHLITAKPMMFIANVDENGEDNNAHLQALQSFATEHNIKVIPLCAQIEAEIAVLGEEDKQEFLQDLGLAEAGLDRVIREGYELLGLQTYFTAGEKEVRAWTISQGFTAPQAAGKIHTDFEKGFIRAEVIGYEDYIQYQGEAGAKDAGRWRLEGKDYIMQDGDVVHFRFNV